MSYFKWSDRFSVGIEEMDQQHKKLIALIDNFYKEKHHNGKNSEALQKTIKELINYTKNHFVIEEKLMQQYKFPEYDLHKFDHESLIDKIARLEKKNLTGVSNITDDLAILLYDWLLIHILIEDKKYGAYLNCKGVT